MTVGDEAQVSRPRMSAEKRARLSAEAWRLKDTEGMSYRTIADRFTKRGDPVSHTTVATLISEAQESAKFLDVIGPAVIRAGQLGRFDTYIEEVRADIKAGLLDPAKGWQLIATFERMMTHVGGSAMPTRMQVETDNGAPTPNMETLRAFAESLDSYDRKKQDIQNNDGLSHFDE